MAGLIETLTNGYNLLKSVGADYWANRINKVLLNSFGSEEQVDVEEILSWFGGMGALNDLVISKYNGHFTNNRDENDINNELKEIVSTLYGLAISVKKYQR